MCKVLYNALKQSAVFGRGLLMTVTAFSFLYKKNKSTKLLSQQDCENKGEILYTVRPYERQGMLITLSDCANINAK